MVRRNVRRPAAAAAASGTAAFALQRCIDIEEERQEASWRRLLLPQQHLQLGCSIAQRSLDLHQTDTQVAGEGYEQEEDREVPADSWQRRIRWQAGRQAG
jgi:hypothetical protein